jgi:hypothetical protein
MSNPEQIGRVRDLIIRQLSMTKALKYSICNMFFVILKVLTATKRHNKDIFFTIQFKELKYFLRFFFPLLYSDLYIVVTALISESNFHNKKD